MDSIPSSGNQDSPSSEGQPNDQTSHTQPPLLPAPTKLEVPPSKPPCKSYAEQKHWLDYVTFGLELLGLIVLCVYAGYTIKIYCANQEAADAAQNTLGEIQKQTKMTRQQLVELYFGRSS